MDNMHIPQEQNNNHIDLSKHTTQKNSVNLEKTNQQSQNNINQQQNNINQQPNVAYQQQFYYQQYPNQQYAYQQQMQNNLEEKKKENALAYTALGCFLAQYIVPFIALIMGEMLSVLTSESSAATGLIGIISSLGSLANIVGLVLMIVTRVKYPKNTIGKVLMWLYIVSAIMYVLLILAVIAFCSAMAYSCRGLS